MADMHDWDDWFKALAEALPDLRKYERLAWDYHLLMAGRGHGDEAQAAWAQRHQSRFWRRGLPMPPKVLVQALAAAGIGLAAGICVPLATGVVQENLARMRQTAAPVTHVSLSSALWLAVAFGLAWLAIFMVRRLWLTVRMGMLERRLAPTMATLPPAYRSGWLVDAICQFHDSFGVGDMASALDACDRAVAADPSSFPGVTVMSDVAFASDDGRVVRRGDGRGNEDAFNPDTSDPALPPDIASHVRHVSATPEADLRALVGMDNVKEQVRQLKNRLEFSEGKAQSASNHMLFMGPAGVGKTTVARIVAGMFNELGYTRYPVIVEVDGDYLKSPYEGQSGARTQAIVNYAHGGVLFIDEAYLLAQGRGSAGPEATGVLLKAMEDLRDDLIVILAGYEDPMTRMLASNEGFRSRIRHTITFKPYTADELMEIMRRMMAARGDMAGMTLSDEAQRTVRDELRRESASPGFGNARAARNALDALYDIHADRVMRGQEPDRKTITEADAKQWLKGQAEAAEDAARQAMAERGIDASIISVDELRTRTHPGSEHPEEDLDHLIGMEPMRRELSSIEAMASFYEGQEGRPPFGHVLLTGPQGCGKTTSVAMLTGELYRLGYIRRNQYVDVSGDFLRAGYLGQTGQRTEAVVSWSLGGVLFVDEAYLLASRDGQADQFGAEAVGVLVNAMEKHTEDLVVVLAGYPREMAELLDVNPGLASRLPNKIELPGYTVREICKIFQLKAAERGFACDRGLWQPLAVACREAMADEHFGNGRWAREKVNEAIRRHAERFAAHETTERRLLEAADVS